MSKIKAVVFDVGGVLLKGSMVAFGVKAARLLGLSPSLRALPKLRGLPKKIERGEVEAEEAIRELAGNVPEKTVKALIRLFVNEYKPDPQMARLVAELKPNYKVAVLSNTNALQANAYREKGYFRPFELCVLSHEIRAVKPDKNAFDVLLNRLRIKAGECVFVDNNWNTCRHAREYGLKVVHFRSNRQCFKALRRLGVEFSWPVPVRKRPRTKGKPKLRRRR